MVLTALQTHAAWYLKKFGECKPEWYVFLSGWKGPTERSHKARDDPKNGVD